MRQNKNKQAQFVSVLALALVLCLTPTGQSQTKGKGQVVFDYAKLVGVASFSTEHPACLDIVNASLQPGQHISLVSLSKPQINGQARILKRLAEKCAVRASEEDENESHYEIQLINGELKAPALAIALVNTALSFKLKNGLAQTDLDGDGQMESFRECTSREGLHLTVWTGMPLRGKRRWHYYYYLGYDVEPSCTTRETHEP